MKREAQRIGVLSATGSLEFRADEVNAIDHIQNHRMVLSGTGALTATVALYKGHAIGGVAVYDTTPAVTYTLSGTTLAVDSARIESAECARWKATVSAISGTEATVTWIVEVGA